MKVIYYLVVYCKIDNTIIKYNGKIFQNEEELKYFFKCIK